VKPVGDRRGSRAGSTVDSRTRREARAAGRWHGSPRGESSEGRIPRASAAWNKAAAFRGVATARSVGPGQLGFTCAVAAETAEGLKKPEGGTGEEVAFLASRGRRELGHGRAGHPELERRRDEESQERRTPEPSARAGGQSSGRKAGREAYPGSTSKGSRTPREDPSRAHAGEGGLDAENPEAWSREGKGKGGEPGARTGTTRRAPQASEGDANLMEGRRATETSRGNRRRRSSLWREHNSTRV
jgi:hypothetical protein